MTTGSEGTSRTRSVLAVILVAMAALYFYGLAGPPVDPPGFIHDECYQAFTAHRYAIGDPHAWRWGERDVLEKATKDDLTAATTYEWVHPPLAKLVMAGFIRAFGFTPTVFRTGSVLAGLLTVAIALLLGTRLFGLGVGALAAIVIALDGMFFVLSRVAMNDIYVTVMLSACVAATYRTWVAPSAGARRGWALVTGLVAGMTIATKWNAAPTLIVSGLAVLYTLWRGERSKVAALALWAAVFVVVPILVYVACYAPYLALGHGLADLLKLQQDIVVFHRGLTAGHSSSSRWYEWPLLVRPVWFYQANGIGEGTLREIYGFGSPLVWWLMFPAVIVLAVHAWRTRSLEDAFVVVPFLAVWLPWAVIGRVTFIQYVLPGLPFGALAIARLASLYGKQHFVKIAAGYGLAVALVFAHFYPILVGRSVPAASVHGVRWFWFPGWRPCSGDCGAPPSKSASASASTDDVLGEEIFVDSASTATAAEGLPADEIELDPQP